MKKLLFHMILILLACVSCQREETVDLDIVQKSKLVPFVFIGAGDSTFSAALTRSTPIIGPSSGQGSEYAMVTTASGMITNQTTNVSYTLAYNANTNAYEPDIKPAGIKAGERYSIQFSEGNETVEGSTTIAEAVEASVSMKFDSSVANGDYLSYNATFTCTSLSKGVHYIQLYPLIVYSDSSFYPMTDLYSHQQIRGIQQGESFTANFSSTFSSQWVHPVRVIVMIISCDEPYTKYYNSSAGFNIKELSPLNEPSFTYSNMSNGVGVIASYNISSIIALPVR